MSEHTEHAPDQDRLLEHNYDGIQEYDNPLPFWWVFLFWGSIVFAAFYVVYFHMGPGLLTIEAYNKDMLAYYDKQAQQFLALGDITESTLYELTDNEAMMSGAKQLFQSRCAQCHGMNGEGNIGPNLTDDYWLHGGKLTDVYHTVSEGVPDKGMLSWKMQLRPAELLAVAAYAGTLRRTDPPNQKAPQGKLEPYEPPVPDEDGAGADGDDGGGPAHDTGAVAGAR